MTEELLKMVMYNETEVVDAAPEEDAFHEEKISFGCPKEMKKKISLK